MTKLNNIKVVFIDIDKTLTNDERIVPKENALAIKRLVEKGIFVVLCSGRNFSYAGQKANDANASSFLITNNGAQIYDYEKHKSLYEVSISKKIVEKLLLNLREIGVEIILNTSNTRFGTKNLKRKLSNDEKFFNEIDELGEENILQIVCEVNSASTMEKLIDIVKRYDNLKISNLSRAFLENKKSDNYYADINNYSTNKGTGQMTFVHVASPLSFPTNSLSSSSIYPAKYLVILLELLCVSTIQQDSNTFLQLPKLLMASIKVE